MLNINLKQMKIKLIGIAMLSLIIACSPETTDELVSQEIDFTQIVNPETVNATAQLDTSEKGIYRGVFAAIDGSYHGKLTVNAGNNSKYDAVLQVKNGGKYGFIASPSTSTHIINFVGPQGSFTLNTAGSKAIIENATIHNLDARATIFKETSQNKVMMTLGTFVDEMDASFGGSWDLVSTSTQTISIPTGLPFPAAISVTVNIIDEIVVMRNGGATFTDAMMENFTPGAGCGDSLPPGSQAPFFTGPQTIFGQSIDEWAISGQTSTFVGQQATWSVNRSLFQGVGGTSIYFDDNCNMVPSGTWSWAGRSGSILID